MSDDNNQREFEYGGVHYAVKRPSPETIKRANALRSKTFNEALQRGDLLRDQLDSELRKRELWNDQREEEYQGLRKGIVDGEFSLNKGGIKLSEAKEIALKMSESRGRMVGMLSTRTDLDSNTCEGKADAARFNLLFAESLVYLDTGEPYFPGGFEEYVTKMEDPVAVTAATEFYYLLSGSEKLDETLPENQFLKKFGFVDDRLRLVDKQGRLIDDEGKHIDELGNYIEWIDDDNYIFVDDQGREVKNGKFNTEFSPFIDDETGQLFNEDGSLIEEEKPKPKRKRRTTKKEKEPSAEEEKQEEPSPEEDIPEPEKQNEETVAESS
tara:strand:+ start:1541 stop:2515 length:975 start_codon:yes stop_codon:yes gene_type:complete